MTKFMGAPYPIQQNVRGYLHTQSDLDQIRSDLLILLLTNPGERCLTGDTVVPLANGTEFAIKELVGMGDFWVYSFDIASDRVVPGLASARKTGRNCSLVKVILDDGGAVRCTPDHFWLLRNGCYCPAEKLQPGQSIMPLYRNKNTSGYERVYQSYLGDYRETHLCFVVGSREKAIREVVHHKDLNKLNNDPDNLQWMTCADHKELHQHIRSKFQEKLDNEPGFYENWLAKQKAGLEKYYASNPGNRCGAVLSEETKKKLSESKYALYDTPEGKSLIERLSEKTREYFSLHGSPKLGKKLSESAKEGMRKPHPTMRGDGNPSKRPEVREKLRQSWIARRAKKNHKIVAVERLDQEEDCFDLSVEKYHNFGLSAGVFVHNCMLPEFGTPLRELIFEPNDGLLEDQARQMIIKSIEAFEPRITVSQIEVSSNIDDGSLNPMDNRSQVENILSIRILFFDPANIQEVQELKLELPLGVL